MNIRQFRYSTDNFSYLLYGQHFAGVIDGGAVEEILAFINAQGLELQFVTNTHKHADHTIGSQDLIKRSRAVFIDNLDLTDNQLITLEKEKIRVYHTPGHTRDSICFHVNSLMVTGDTLFNGTVGNCFSGDLKGFYRSIKMLMSFPDDTIIYAGHDYVKDSMTFAKYLEPDNKDIDRFLEKYNSDHLFSTLQEERKINPYLKFNDPKIIAFLKQKRLPVNTEMERWESLMSIE